MSSETSDREIVISRLINAPRELVFEAYSELRHLSKWWGPEGFTTTTQSFDFRVGGEWNFVMHSPDGVDFQEWIKWIDITPPDSLFLLHGATPDDPDAFESHISFTSEGEATRIEMKTIFPTREMRDEVVEKYHAIEGGQQTLSKLNYYVMAIFNEGR